MTVSTLPPNSLLCDVSVYDVDSSGHLVDAIGSPIDRLACQAIESGSAEVATQPESLIRDASAAIAIPIYRDQRIVSVTVLSSKQLSDSSDDVVGVFEVWEPIGSYQEVALKRGFYGRMERFHNVSSFVRFEKGNGLPGQVWQQRSAVIHDDLSNHPGFLRAAGASADLLKTAVGIPVASSVFRGAAVLISSVVSPLARGIEVWCAEQDGFSLLGGAYSELGNGSIDRCTLAPKTKSVGEDGLPGLARIHGGAILCDDVDRIYADRDVNRDSVGPIAGLAIPFFDGESLTSVTSLLL